MGASSKRRSGGQAGAEKAARNKRPGTVLALLILTAIQAIGAIAGGVGLVQDPIDNIGMSLSILEGSPFDDFLVPGLILLIVVGLFPLFVLAGLLRRWKPAWWLVVVSGAGLVIWIVVEVALLGFLPDSGTGLQVGMGVLGLAILVLALVRPTRRYFGISA
jgi:hypothetical protein